MKKKILIIEDEAMTLSALKEKFMDEGFYVAVAKNGEEGLEEAFLEKPDLILLDIIMPKMDGITMLKKLQNDERGKKIPVIILTNLSDPDSVYDSIDNGAYNYLVKTDWSMEDVVKKVRGKLGM